MPVSFCLVDRALGRSQIPGTFCLTARLSLSPFVAVACPAPALTRAPALQIGTGWDQNLWSPSKPLTRLDLDAALPGGRPCLLYRRCWHAVVVNSAALRAAGFDPNKAWSPAYNADPPPSSAEEGDEDAGAGGEGRAGKARERDRGERAAGETAEGGQGEGVDTDDAGRPTGLFREGSMRLVEAAITAPAFEIRCNYGAAVGVAGNLWVKCFSVVCVVGGWARRVNAPFFVCFMCRMV